MDGKRRIFLGLEASGGTVLANKDQMRRQEAGATNNDNCVLVVWIL
jgi:hypothetical protein